MAYVYRPIDTSVRYKDQVPPRAGFTVGFYDPDGEWHENEHFDQGYMAAKKCNYLNGGTYDEDVKNVLKRFGRLEDRLTILIAIIAAWAVFSMAL